MNGLAPLALLASLAWTAGATAQEVIEPVAAASADELDVITLEGRHYVVDYLTPPPGEVLEVGGIDQLSDGRLVVTTRRGHVWIVEDALAEQAADARFHLFAEGLHEGLGVQVVVEPDPDGRLPGATRESIYVVQRGELSRLLDEDGDGVCDRIDTVTSAWGLSDNYHEFAFGLPRDPSGAMYLALNVAFLNPEWWLGRSIVPWRGWVLRATTDGGLEPVASGLRSPCGLGVNAAGDLFVTDNQGDWMPAGPLFHIQEGNFYGHPASLAWTDDFRRTGREPSTMDPPERERAPAALWFPYKWSRSAGNLVADSSGGAFGPFEDQLFVAELTNGHVLRVQLERVRGEYQGACFLFRQRIGSAARVFQASDGTLFAGFTNRGWGGLPPSHGIARIRYTGAEPFEMERVHLLQDGFEVTFTAPLAVAPTPADVTLTQYDYDYWWEYGSPERRTRAIEVTATSLSDDGRVLTLRTAGLTPAMVARCVLSGVVSEDGAPLLHDEFNYTINQLPEGPATTEHVAKQAAPPPPKGAEDQGWLRLSYGDALDAWESTGWALVNAELDPDDRGTFQIAPGNNALVNVGHGPASDYVCRYDSGSGVYHVEFMLPEGGSTTVWIQGRYGIEIADAPGRTGTLAAGPSRAALPPALDVYHGAGQWHSLDVVFEAPRFRGDVKLSDARFALVSLDEITLHEDVALTAPSLGAPLQDEGPLGPLVIGGTTSPLALRTLKLKPVVGGDPAPAVPLLGDGGDDALDDCAFWPTDGEDGWDLDDGTLTGEGPRSLLVAPRRAAGRFELRARCRLDEGAAAGIVLRASPDKHGEPVGYHVRLNASFADPERTGSIAGLAPVKVSLVPPGTWFDLAVTCDPGTDGTRLAVAIGGVVVAEVVDTARRFTGDLIALEQHHEGAGVAFRELRLLDGEAAEDGD